MKKLLICVLLGLVGCAGAQVEPKAVVKAEPPVVKAEPEIEKECIDLTREVKRKRDLHEYYVNSVSEYIQAEVQRVVVYLTDTYGTDFEVRLEDRMFVDDYSVSIIYASLYVGGDYAGGVYWLLADPHKNHNWVILGTFIKKPPETNADGGDNGLEL